MFGEPSRLVHSRRRRKDRVRWAPNSFGSQIKMDSEERWSRHVADAEAEAATDADAGNRLASKAAPHAKDWFARSLAGCGLRLIRAARRSYLRYP